MLGRLLARRRPWGGYAPPRPERVLYAVGDVHGRADLLAQLWDRILDDAGGEAEVVFLGDYVDRGDASREVVAFLTTLGRAAPLPVRFLMGNHERMLLDFLADAGTGGRWLRNGGAETLESYGVAPPAEEAEPEALAAAQRAFAGAVGPHLAFLEGLALSHLSGNVLCVHAGADPARAPERQEARALLWGHPAFEGTRRRDGIWCVHGHSVVPHPEARPGRIAVDTGAWFTDSLTAARISEGEVRFLSTG